MLLRNIMGRWRVCSGHCYKLRKLHTVPWPYFRTQHCHQKSLVVITSCNFLTSSRQFAQVFDGDDDVYENSALISTSDLGHTIVDSYVTSPDHDMKQTSDHLECCENTASVENVLLGKTELFSDYGLGGWDVWPAHWLQNMMEFLHCNLELAWIPTLVVTTAVLRTLAFPAFVKMQAFAVRSHNTMPEQMKLQQASLVGNKIQRQRNAAKYMEYLVQQDVNPLKQLMYMVPNAVMFTSFFAALRQMTSAQLPSLSSEGVLWFVDLTQADPYFLLPIISCTSMHLLIRFGAASSETGGLPSNSKIIKNILLWSPFAILPFIMTQPSALFIFWLTSNSYSFALSVLFKQKLVRTYFNIPERKCHSINVNPINYRQQKKNLEKDQELAKEAMSKMKKHFAVLDKFSAKKSTQGK